jgi:hypothetical protein
MIPGLSDSARASSYARVSGAPRHPHQSVDFCAELDTLPFRRLSHGQCPCSSETGAYCQARKRLPEEFFSEVSRQAGRALEANVDPQWLWKGLQAGFQPPRGCAPSIGMLPVIAGGRIGDDSSPVGGRRGIP